jgi:hypothetical protein
VQNPKISWLLTCPVLTFGARFEHDDRCLDRPVASEGVVLGFDCDPSLPELFAFVAGGEACVHPAWALACEADGGVRMSFEIEPPRRVALVPAVHGEEDEIGAVFEVADDDAALLAGLPPYSGEL